LTQWELVRSLVLAMPCVRDVGRSLMSWAGVSASSIVEPCRPGCWLWCVVLSAAPRSHHFTSPVSVVVRRRRLPARPRPSLRLSPSASLPPCCCCCCTPRWARDAVLLALHRLTRWTRPASPLSVLSALALLSTFNYAPRTALSYTVFPAK